MARASASKINTLRRCQKQFEYAYLQKLQRVAKSIAPARGTLIHECLKEHYSGKDWTKPLTNLTIEWEKLFDEERAEWGDLPKELYRIVRGYLVAYKQLDAKIKTIATEVHFEIPMSNDHPMLGTHVYEGYIDWIFEDENGAVWVADHKTVKSLPSDLELYMDLQTFMYYEACRTDPNLIKLLNGRKLAGVMFNHIRTKAPKEPAILKSGALSKAKCDTDVATYFETVKKNGLNPADYEDMIEQLKDNVFYKRTKIPVSEATIAILKAEILDSMESITVFENTYGEASCSQVYPRTMLKNRCAWDCEFRTLCFAELAGMDTTQIRQDQYKERGKREESEETDGEETDG